ncbi:pyridoxamine 5'-phosphate oxidase family protein [Brevibacillus choshinensis]|uniref:Pyridoxamine 5'-phosphate oxidase family protein n=1 Tax=Brevibacillus choshinensis TaxID=54911 RepID=A0ABX7FIJ2_BRECH|nr:pyridoxamine 5'-phosphate oxidase family protein [Brevibacillus choshinensis]QRG66046.1 pyridoxamine 5'-phosphate oxidase family protein [Brevibacillus choshinensis]
MEPSGEQRLRDKFQTGGIRVGQKLTPLLRRYVEAMEFFFIATADRNGNCDCSFRGGVPAVKALDDETLLFPDYPGNGAFQSLGNILENPRIGMLFIDFSHQQRLRINGKAEVLDDPSLCEWFPGSIQVVRVTVEEVYRNCSARIPKLVGM